MASAAAIGFGYGAIAGASSPDVLFYSTAAPPQDYLGPEPPAPVVVAEPPTVPAEPRQPISEPPAEHAPTRLASAEVEVPAPRPARPAAPPASDPIAEAKAAIASCKATFDTLKDYTCTFYKRERIDGEMTSYHQMAMKARTKPASVYFKFLKPNAGREAIWVSGGFGGKVVVHDVGIGKLIAGTLRVDPRGDMAMEENRHPITEAGIGHMIDTIATAWAKELHQNESRVILHPNAKVGDRRCLMIESIHPRKQPGFLYHMVKVYIDTEHNLPIRFEAYDWPRAGRAADLVEEYTYSDLKLNVGLTGRDFDPANKGYSFGRF
jgi:hypothetical protein